MDTQQNKIVDGEKGKIIDLKLSKEEIRVLGALMEKEVTTPDYYPLSLNALKNACNQTTNRNPIVSYDEASVQKSLDFLKEENLVWDSNLGRAIKYGESLSIKAHLVPRETIILALLMLKGQQTPGALRARADRACPFKTLEEVHEVLDNLSEWGFIQEIPRQAGHKEVRYVHLLADSTQNEEKSKPLPHTEIKAEIKSKVALDLDKVKQLEAELKQLRSDFEQFKTELLNFKNQF